MSQTICGQCGKTIEQQTGAAFCPFCGGELNIKANVDKEPEAVRKLLENIENMTDIRKKHALLMEAEQEYPGSLAIAQELLFMGRLYERGGKRADFSIIKCFLYKMYLTPEEFPEKRMDEMRTELFSHPMLIKCLELSEDKEAFMRTYLMRLSAEFITLFLRGDSRYMQRFFGFSLGGNAAKLLAHPVARMLMIMRKDDKLTQAQRDMLMQQFYGAFSREMGGETKWLDTKLSEAGISIGGVA